MQNIEKIHAQIGSVSLNTMKDFSMNHSSRNYTNDYQRSDLFERYISTLKELCKQQEVSRWIANHMSKCLWIENLLGPYNLLSSSHQMFCDYQDSSDVVPVPIPSETHHHENVSDSDINETNNYSDDDDSRYSYPVTPEGCEVSVVGSGCMEINGTYKCCGICDGVSKYAKSVIWNGTHEVISIFRCRLSDNTKKWYISIVPKNIQPGTSKDFDFYYAPATDESNEIPHGKKWETARDNGIIPPPTVTWRETVIPGHDD